jgi:hypothetical protein
MKKYFILFFLFSFLFLNNASADITATLQGISKIYIEYENSQYQVIELPQKVDYSYTLNDSNLSQNTTMSTLLQLGELNQNSKILRIALWIDNYIQGGMTFPVNGYVGGSRSGPTGTTSIPITSWDYGTVTNLNGEQDETNYHHGVINFNSTGSYSADNNGTITTTDGASFDASNESINLRFKQYGGYLSADVQTQNL